jgi:Amt family ammonium transporter
VAAWLVGGGALFAIPSAARAAEPATSGDAAWLLTASALVLFMTLPGLALFYGGLVRARNLLSVLMHCFVVCCIVSLLWVIVGYSLVFGGDGAAIGGLSRAVLAHVSETVTPQGLPESIFVLFQMTFAVITPALIVGAFPERVSFPFLILFTAGWLLLVYCPVAHWVWGQGWLAAEGTLDFAGGIVVHTTAGVSALVATVLIGARRGFPHTLSPPHSPGMTMAGGGMLWVGWFGFNGGSALAAGNLAGMAVLATHCAAAAAALTWIGFEWVRVRKPTSIGLVTGSVAGLATITPASGFVGPLGAIAIGAAGATLCFFATSFIKNRLRIDDTLDVFAVHGVGGMLGSLLLAPFAATALGGAGYAVGMTLGTQFLAQLIGVVAAAAWSAAVTFGLVKLLATAMDLRVGAEQEYDGLDLAVHGERAYDHS